MRNRDLCAHACEMGCHSGLFMGVCCTAALDNEEALCQVARMGVTVTAVIHQPSYGIFRMFDDLLLLCKGGRTAYYGKQEAVQVSSSMRAIQCSCSEQRYGTGHSAARQCSICI